MEQDEAVAMLKSLIANIEADHVEVTGVKHGDISGDAFAITLIMNGEPKIGRVEG